MLVNFPGRKEAAMERLKLSWSLSSSLFLFDRGGDEESFRVLLFSSEFLTSFSSF